MAYEFRLPELGEGIDGGVVVNILVQLGQIVKEEDPFLEIESNKAVLVVPSPISGKILEILVHANEEIKVGSLIALIRNVGTNEKDNTKIHELDSSKSLTKNKTLREEVKEEENKKQKIIPPLPISEKIINEETKSLSSSKVVLNNSKNYIPISYDPEMYQISAGPATRKMARELGVDLKKVEGTKKGERITVEDVKNFVKFIQTSGFREKQTIREEMSLPDFTLYGPVRREPASFIRKMIDQRMSYSWKNIPHVFQFNESDITDITRFHKKYSEEFKKKGSTTSITPFIIKALSHCLCEFPQFNASYDSLNKEIIYKEYFHIGVAVDTNSGLIVPVIKNVNSLSIFEIGRLLRDLAKRARERKVTPEELAGASMTVSNLGGIGGTFFTPLINPPEVAILGIGKSEIKPVYKEGEWVPRTFTSLCLSYDHRVIDGADGARFIVRLTEILQNFERFLLGG